MPSLNPACVSTMGMVTRSPKTWALALSLREEVQGLAPNHALGGDRVGGEAVSS